MAKLPDYENHLAAAVLNDGRIISYRLLSRELSIHSNVAKRMLFEFHRKQNAKKQGSVHATYLLDGTPKPITIAAQSNGHTQDGEDVPMQSSPFVSSAVQEEERAEEYATPSRSIILAREEDLEGAKSKLDTIYSIHVYSLQPNKLQNLQVLSDCNRTISSDFNSEDPLIAGQKYGVIHNSGVRRRAARQLPPGAASSTAAAPRAPKPAPPKTSEETKPNPKVSAPSTQDSTHSSRPASTATNKPSTLKKEHSDIFKSFSKTKTPLKKETSDASTINSPAGAGGDSQGSAAPKNDDSPMKDDDDDDQEEDTFTPATNKADPQARTARSQRAEQLRKMMDDDDDDDPESQNSPPDDDSEMPDADPEEPSPDADPRVAPKSPTPEPPPSSRTAAAAAAEK